MNLIQAQADFLMITISAHRRTIAFLLMFSAIFGCIHVCKAQKDTLNEAIIHPPLDLNLGLTNWLYSFDLDGDNINDSITFDYTGGAHCCYLIDIRLSSEKILRTYPFEMDGGYIGGVDNSLPEQFDIRDIDQDGLPEILMRIQTYNLRPYPIPKKWKRKYGIKTNKIIIEYSNGRLLTRDDTGGLK